MMILDTPCMYLMMDRDGFNYNHNFFLSSKLIAIKYLKIFTNKKIVKGVNQFTGFDS